MRRFRSVPALVALLLGAGFASACADAATGPVSSFESDSHTEGQGFGNTEGQGFGNAEGQGFGNVEGQGFGNVVVDTAGQSAEGQGFGN